MRGGLSIGLLKSSAGTSTGDGSNGSRLVTKRPQVFVLGSIYQSNPFWYILWVDEILHHQRHPGMMILSVNTNEQRFPMVSNWCEMDFVHRLPEQPIYISLSHSHIEIDQLIGGSPRTRFASDLMGALTRLGALSKIGTPENSAPIFLD